MESVKGTDITQYIQNCEETTEGVDVLVKVELSGEEEAEELPPP